MSNILYVICSLCLLTFLGLIGAAIQRRFAPSVTFTMYSRMNPDMDLKKAKEFFPEEQYPKLFGGKNEHSAQKKK